MNVVSAIPNSLTQETTRDQSRSLSARGFTLIELLVVVAIIAILAAILLPTLSRARQNAQKASGMNNLRQVGLAVVAYRADNGDWAPNNGTPGFGNWGYPGYELLIPRYVPSNLIYSTSQHNTPCPNLYYRAGPLTLGTVGCNFNLMGGHHPSDMPNTLHAFRDVRNPSTTFLLTHNFNAAGLSASVHIDWQFDNHYPDYSPPYWAQGSFFYFVDDHIEWLPYQGGSPNSAWNKLHPSPDTANWHGGGLLIFGP